VATIPAITQIPTRVLVDSITRPGKPPVITISDGKEEKPVVQRYRFTKADVIRIFTERTALKAEFHRLQKYYMAKYKDEEWMVMMHHAISHHIGEELMREAMVKAWYVMPDEYPQWLSEMREVKADLRPLEEDGEEA
jgi:hypothetical protein